MLSIFLVVVMGISGIFVGFWLCKFNDGYEKVVGLLVIGVVLLVLGCIWDLVFFINKKIWISLYVFYIFGVVLLFLGLVYWLVDLKGFIWWMKFFVIYGINVFFVFVLFGLVVKLMYLIKWMNVVGEEIFLKFWIWNNFYEFVFIFVKMVLFVFVIMNVLFFFFFFWIFYCKKIFIKV